MVTQDSEFNQLQEISIKQFNDLNIKIYGTYENPFFKAKDIGELLGIKKIEGLDNECKVLKVSTSILSRFSTENSLLTSLIKYYHIFIN
jgi:prophage antirepressor-like protein